jgi:hypothetical protein
MPGMRQKDEASQENNQREEDYEKLFPKIGRDFVTREDLADILAKVISAVPGLQVEVGNAKAVALATEYKNNLEKGQSDRKKYEDKDLVKLDEEKTENKE